MAGQQAGNARPPERQLIPGLSWTFSTVWHIQTTATFDPISCCSPLAERAVILLTLGSSRAGREQEDKSRDARKGKC
ncbi:hypothetical protein AV530_013344 [Patagioenas fasciata monilis]|uniref:Uncharacterized protein n=1 Tax=Patagioenas fasciata monilis TaxID=372326 RepID=A0A1V4JP09_PATFA|nr:hypothetical protein AV530_013344 [Patagioenas fasciata monilis]